MSDPELVAWVRQWVGRAEEDFDVARHLLKLGDPMPAGAVCFHAQQCVEKYLKGLLAWHGVHFRKIHDLEKLIDLLPAGVALALAPGDLAVLNRYMVEGRYPGDWPQLTTAGAKEAVTMAERARDSVRALLPPETLQQ